MKIKNFNPSYDMTPVKVEKWYNRSEKSWVIQLLTKDNFQIGDAIYIYSKAEAIREEEELKKEYNL